MIPRFSNPHVLQTSTKLTSRADLCDLGGDAKIDSTNEDFPTLTKRLREFVQDELGNVVFASEERHPRRKRQKLEGDLRDAEQETLIPFRLVSSTHAPHKVSLMPKPPPPVLSIEPEYEDNEIQAEQRTKRAQSVAVDFRWVVRESKMPFPSPSNGQRKILYVTTSFQVLEQLPALLITEHSQAPRNTRPPVPVASHLTSLTSTGPLSPATRPDRPIIPIELLGGSKIPRSVRSRRRRRKSAIKERSQPTFWRPDPAVRGKSLGYAMGYPGSWSPYEAGSRRYERDTMRKGVLVDAIWN